MALPPVLQNTRLPVIGSPLFIISSPELVIAQCKAGVIGSFPALNARPEAQLDDWLDRITSELADHNAKNPDRPAAPFAVNQIVHKSNNRLEHDVEMCVKYKVPLVITSLGAVAEVVDAATERVERPLGLAGGRRLAARRGRGLLDDRLRLIDISNNLGDSKSLITHPATTTHQRLSPEARAELGISDSCLRLSVGLEDAQDICADLAAAAQIAAR
jgi:hypothetical protein